MARPAAGGRFLVAPACLLAATLAFALTAPGFMTFGNLGSVGAQMWVLALLAVGQAFAIASRGFDISVGAVAGLSSAVGALAANAFGWPALALGAAVGLLCGSFNGLLIGRAGLQPIVATLGTFVLARGVALLATDDGQAVPLVASDFITRLAFEPIAGLPALSWLAIGFVALAACVFNKLAIGRRILMLGSNPDAIALIGADAPRTYLRAYQLCGLFAGLAGVLITGRAGSGLSTDGAGMELQAIAAAVIGGTALGGGVARVLPVVIGAAFIQVLLTGLNLQGISPFVAQACIGFVIIGSGLAEVGLRRALSSRLTFRSAT